MNEITKIEHDASGRAIEPQNANQPPSLLNFIATALERPEIDVTKLEALLRMQREVQADDAKSQFNTAMIRLQSRLPKIKKNGVLEYPVDKNKPDGPKRKIANFAKWEDIDDAIRPLLDEEGFSLAFNTAPRQGDGGGLIVTAILRHRAGHSTETSIPIPLDTSGGKNNIQGYGSALSYGKRYAATAALNIVTEGEDDDGVIGGMQFITAEQADELDRLIDETKANRGKFLQYFGVAHISNLPAASLAPARNLLLAKKKAERP